MTMPPAQYAYDGSLPSKYKIYGRVMLQEDVVGIKGVSRILTLSQMRK